MKINTDSPVLVEISNIYHNSIDRDMSWSKLNQALHDKLKYSRDHFKFEEDDFQRISEGYGFSYWGGIVGNQLGEDFYSLAATVGNIGACKSFESWKKRGPFFLDHERIYVGREFQWEDELVICTSFSEDQQGLVACSYREQLSRPSTQIKSRHKITRRDLRKN